MQPSSVVMLALRRKERIMKLRCTLRLSTITPKLSLGTFLALAVAVPLPVEAANWGRPTYSSPIAINPNDRLIWVVNPSDNSVSVIRPDNNTRLAKIPVGDEPKSIALTPDNQYAYVANAAAGTVTSIQISDPAWGTCSASVTNTLTTGAEPW